MLVQILILLSVLLIGCGSDIKELPDELPNEIVNDNKPAPTLELENPICEGVQQIKNGTISKPVSEGGGPFFSGNYVFLIESKFIKAFDSCSIELKDGTEYNLECGGPVDCFTNGGRQTWRSRIKAEKIKKRARITCKEFKQECVWRLPGAATNRFE